MTFGIIPEVRSRSSPRITLLSNPRGPPPLLSRVRHQATTSGCDHLKRYVRSCTLQRENRRRNG